MLTFHHVGVIVPDILQSIETYAVIFGNNRISPIYDIASQGVRVCFVQTGNQAFIELIQQVSPDSVIKTLVKKGVSYYHVGYKVANIEEAVAFLQTIHHKSFSYFNSEAFNGKRCIFLINPDGHIIELIEE